MKKCLTIFKFGIEKFILKKKSRVLNFFSSLGLQPFLNVLEKNNNNNNRAVNLSVICVLSSFDS